MMFYKMPALKLTTSIFLLNFFLFFVSKPVFAATIPYTITTGIPGMPVQRFATFFQTEFTINYQTGKIMLSGNPDGTGNTVVDDAIEIIITRANSTTVNHTHFYASLNCSSIDSFQPLDFTSLFLPGENRVTVKLKDFCGFFAGSSPLYLVNINAPNPTPTPTPTPTPIPTSTPTPAPTPFLDLPWDYQGEGLSFNEAALSITSYFDHEYPLLSSGISEPATSLNTITSFRGEFRVNFDYSSHDGYDYAKKAKVNMGDPVLAAADGTAFLGDKNDCGACGNYILIDHGNGYQTRYYHMQEEGLIVKEGEEKEVKKGDQIGKVGATGNVSPAGDAGAHIHFMVVEDKDDDGDFEDNLPDGVTDPFGWQSKDPDPWPLFEFKNNEGNVIWTGNKSFYLWINKLDNLDATLTSNGGVFKTERYTLDFPANSTSQNLNISLQSSPIVNIGNTLSSIGSTITATAEDLFGNPVTQFLNSFTLIIDFSSFDLTRYDTETISIYSSSDEINWTKEETDIDWQEKTASAQLNHFTHFALLAERIDITAPTTTADLLGDEGQDNWFRSNVQVILNADDGDGLGVDYTMYRIAGGDWEIYTDPLTFTTEGHHQIEFYSADNDENLEDIKLVEFDIDKTLPDASMNISPTLIIWPPDGRLVDINVSGSGLDEHLNLVSLAVDDEYDQYDSTKQENSIFNDIIQLEAKRNGSDLDGRWYTIKVIAEDLAGNKTVEQTQVLVPHDQR